MDFRSMALAHHEVAGMLMGNGDNGTCNNNIIAFHEATTVKLVLLDVVRHNGENMSVDNSLDDIFSLVSTGDCADVLPEVITENRYSLADWCTASVAETYPVDFDLLGCIYEAVDELLSATARKGSSDGFLSGADAMRCE